MKAPSGYRNERSDRPAVMTMIFGSVGSYVLKRDEPPGVFSAGAVLFDYPWRDLPSLSRER